MAERFKAPVLKTGGGESRPWVRILLSPPYLTIGDVMQRVYVLRGLQASGKSTFARNLLRDEPNEWKRINRDLIREMLDDSVWSAKNEKFVVKTRDFLIVEALRKGLN